MNRYEFENLISEYLEGELSFSKRKEFESYLEENEEAKLLFFRVKNTLNDMKNAEKISTPENFNSKLLSKITGRLDYEGLDQTLVDGIGKTANNAGKNLKTMQTGRLQNYMLFALIGVIIILVFQIT